MPTNLTEFADDSAFERYILDRATPLLPRSQGTSVIELGEGGSYGVAVGPPALTVRVQRRRLNRLHRWTQLSAGTTSVLSCSAPRGRCSISCANSHWRKAGVPHDAGSRYQNRVQGQRKRRAGRWHLRRPSMAAQTCGRGS